MLPSTAAKESTSAAAGLQHETAEYRIVEPGELAQEVTRRVIALRDVLEIPTDVCESLLVATSWSRERVMERFLEDGDKLLEEQGVRGTCSTAYHPRATHSRCYMYPFRA